MIISSINFSSFRIPFLHPFHTAKGIYTYREGIIIEIKSGNYSGFGETSPLPKFSNEFLIEARNCIEGFSLAIKDVTENQSIEDLLLLAKAHSIDCPSAQFGLESAIYDLYTKIKKIPFWKYFSNSCCDFITVNGLEKDLKKNTYSVYKLKLMNQNIFNIKEKFLTIYNQFDENIKIRLDANGSLDLPRAIHLCKELEEFNIEYIEQPIPKNNLEELAELRMHTEIPIAVDESLTNLNSAIEIINKQSADIFVIKPMITGSISECLDIIELGEKYNIKSIITTTLGTEIERQVCIQIAFAGNIQLANGFSTHSLLKENIISNIHSESIIKKPNTFGINLIPTQIPFYI